MHHRVERRCSRILTLTALLTGLILVPSANAAPALCTADVIETTLTGAGHELNEGVNLVHFGDVTGDGATDVVFTVATGGTAGDAHFGVDRGRRRQRRRGRALRRKASGLASRATAAVPSTCSGPYYRATDAICCPSSFRQTRYTWTGTRFKTKKLKTVKTAPSRFYRR